MPEQIILHPVGEVVPHLTRLKAYLGTTSDEEALRFALAQTIRLLPETLPTLPDQAQIWRDVAGITGLLLPFVQLVWKGMERPRIQQEQRRQIREHLLENAGDPYQFFHIVSEHMRRLGRSVSLHRADGTYFFYDQALRLLREAAIAAREEELPNADEELPNPLKLLLSYDEVLAVFASLRHRYHTPGLYQTLVKEVRVSLEPYLPLAHTLDTSEASTSTG